MSDSDDGAGLIDRLIIDQARKTITEVFGEFEPDDVRHAIMADSPLVKNRAPEPYVDQLQRRGQNYEHVFRGYVHPDTVWGWLVDTSWAPTSDVEQELHEFRAAIEETPGGKEWFEDQVYDVWEIAGIDPPADRRSID